MKRLIVLSTLLSVVASTLVAVTVNYGWEDGGTILSSYGNVENPINVASDSDPGTNNETPTYDPMEDQECLR